MVPLPHSVSRVLILSATLWLTGCGGGSDSRNVGSNVGVTIPLPAPDDPLFDANAPAATGDVALDVLNWFNYRRFQLSLPPVQFDSRLDAAAQNHSEYQAINNVITHIQEVGRPAFTGVTQEDRMANAGYRFTRFPNAYGEVLAATTDPSGFNAAESLLTAIYHRFVVLEPEFTAGGTGAAVNSNGVLFVTANFTADGLGNGLGIGRAVVYPFPNQQAVPRVFFSNAETPDPVPGVDAVGYPVSIHADLEASIGVSRFTIRPRNGLPLPTTLLTSATDPATPPSAAAIIPLTVLLPRTIYDVEFDGVVDDSRISASWSFSTR